MLFGKKKDNDFDVLGTIIDHQGRMLNLIENQQDRIYELENAVEELTKTIEELVSVKGKES